jgi:hypothetical protein
MLYHILFTARRFNLSEVKSHFINDCCFGEDLADWLRLQLAARGAEVHPIYQEDWGWEFRATHSGGSYYIGVGGNSDEDASDKNRGEWRVMISKRRSLTERLLGNNKLVEHEPIIATIKEILQGEPDFSKIHTDVSR